MTGRGTAQPLSLAVTLSEQQLDELAHRIAAHVRLPETSEDRWLDTREAATYLGMHRDTIRRLAAERALPFEQDGPGCKLYVKRSALDAWRVNSGRA